MVDRRQSGFTVIEVLMFLAISGLLLIGAVVGLNGSINNTRFNDAVNSTTSYLQKQYAEVTNGQNTRNSDLGCLASDVSTDSPSSPGMSSCVMLGRLLQFGTTGANGSVISSRYIVGQYDPTVTGSDSTVLASSVTNPRAINQDSLNTNFQVPWSTDFRSVRRGITSVNYIAIMRSPVSERILFYSFNAPAGIDLLRPYMTNANLNQPLALCMSDDNRIGYIRIGAGQGQDVIRSDLTVTTGVCP